MSILSFRTKPRSGFRRHGIVELGRITMIDIVGRTVGWLDRAGRAATLRVQEGFFLRSIPARGDRLIRYADGHVSHSKGPAAGEHGRTDGGDLAA
ncbi:hypothetical protein [Mangrovibrevibacter kandeliae]|uniref:hypothetical protein n=1 Tax=Mangrovibrevibacter kandeliae TaxID=2968473 RepID=UPI00211968EE|nr:hypothetical protein [Aurantimonas sp. CSK15Z-1]MCQ8784158.1 hypothetical protein [Aurantimonas sp. CSK15Z-1]